MRARLAAIAVTVVLPMLPAAVATAQPKNKGEPPDQVLQEKAAGLVQRGIECQSRRETGCAVGLYTQAYCLIPEPALIYNIGTAYQEGGKANDALRWFRLYLKQAPSGDLAKEAKSKIAQLKPASTAGETGAAEISCKKPTVETKVTPPAETPVCAPGEKYDGTECVADAGAIRQPPPPVEGKKSRPIMLYAGVGTATLGAVGLGIGLAYGVKAKNASDALSENAGPWTAELLAKQDEGESAERKQIMFTIVGGVALVGGAALVIVGLRKNRPAEERVGAELVPVVSPDTAGFAISGRY